MIKGNGIDIIEIARIARALERHGPRFTRKVFLPAEIAYCETKVNPAPYYAARFAAKEAVMKALGTGFTAIRWHDILITHDPAGRPAVALAGTAQHQAARHGITQIHLSISHCQQYAVACAVAE